jgi:threonyl-tRNA synthetase
MRQVYKDTGYQEVKGPQILDKSLWEKTGHWQNYRENMFTTESEKREYALKPMNCPGHVLIFKSQLRSYRDLPLRFGEFGQCHRNEPSGALHGIMRVRGFTQDDGHAFVHGRPDPGGVRRLHGQAAEGLPRLRLHRHPLQGRDAAGEPGRLRRAVGQGRARLHGSAAPLRGRLRGLARRRRLLRPEDRIHAEGRAGPAVAVRHDAGRLQHGGAPGRGIRHGNQRPRPPGDAAPGHRRQPRAFPRHADRTPCRRAARLAGAGAGGVLNITDGQADYARDVAKTLQNQGLRVELDLRNEKITYKIREHSMQKPPYILVVGDKEKAAGAVAVRARGNKDLGAMSLERSPRGSPRTSPARADLHRRKL